MEKIKAKKPLFPKGENGGDKSEEYFKIKRTNKLIIK
jgi:hypothetical protein